MICGGHLTALVESQSFTSPFYPQFYPVQAFCEWIIATVSPNQTILLNLEDFQTQACCDFLLVSISCMQLIIILIALKQAQYLIRQNVVVEP